MACLVAVGRPVQVPAPVAVSHPKPLKLVASFVALLLLGAYVQFVWLPVYESTARLQQGRQAASIGRFDRAHALLDTASAADALSPAAAYLNGRLYLQEAEHASTGRTSLLEKAAQCLCTAIDRDPADYKNYEKAGDVASLMGKPDAAYGWYAKAAGLYPGSGRLQLRLAQTAEQQADTAAALRHYRQAIEIEDAFQRQFRQMYPEREQMVSRLGREDYELAKRRIAELAN
jgi:tetratricopeptide (TPR) repeat protein